MAVRGVKGKNEVRVFLRGGIYYRDKPVIFTSEDSGTKEYPVTWAGYKDEKVIISAGREITGWKQKEGYWEADIPAVKNGEWYFGQLFTRVSGAEFFTRRYRPVKGMLAVAGHSTSVLPKDPRNSGSPIKAWKFFPGDVGRWENMSNVEFVAFHSWSSSRFLPRRVDYENHEIEFTDYPHYRVTNWYGVHNPYYAENIKEEFGKPGEWYLDTGRGVIMYTPAAGETIEKTTVVAPVLEQIMIVKGDYSDKNFVEHLVFKNLSFMHMAWHIPPGGFGLLHFGVSGIASAATRSLHIRNNLIDGTPYHGMGLEIGTTDHATGTIIERNELTNIVNLLEDGAAIYGHFQQDKTVEADAVIRGNHIYNSHASQVAASSKQAGIYPDHGSWGCVVEDNVIYDIDGRPLFGTLDAGLAKARVNATPEEANTIRGNVIDVLPGDPEFPSDLVEQAGIEKEYRDIVKKDLPGILPQVYSMPMFDRSKFPVGFFAGFENSQPGHAPLEVDPSGRQENNYVEITGEDGYESRQCLKFADGPSVPSYFPLIRKGNIGIEKGVMRLSFDFRNSSDAPGTMNMEMRDKSQPFRIGPRLKLLPDGTIAAGDNDELVKFSPGQWVHVTIDFTLKPEPGKTFNVTVAQGRNKTQKSFSFVHDEFQILQNILFMADALCG